MPKFPYGLKGPVLVVGDVHLPEANQECLEWVYEVARREKPSYIVQVGDLFDMFNLSKFAKTLNYMTPEEELDRGVRMASEMWRELQKAAPKAECHQLVGNHDVRAVKRLIEKAPELEGFMKWDHLFKFPSVKTHMDDKEEIFLGDVIFMHGFRKHGEHAKFNQTYTVCGHSHTGGVVYYQNKLHTYWELNAGFVGNLDSPVFRYRNQRRLHGWTNGCGLIDADGPRFLSYKP